MEKGFSLPDMLVAIALSGILAGIATPFYLGHIKKAQILEGLSLASRIKLDIQEYALSKPLSSITDNASLNLPAPEDLAGEYVSAIQISKGGTIKISYENLGGSISLKPINQYGYFKWLCQSNSPNLNSYLPKQCKNAPLKTGAENGK